MSHLGPRISSLVDGELGHSARERALAHVAHCRPCRDQLDGERRVKGALGAAGTPAPSDQMMAALAGLAGPGVPLPPQSRRLPAGPLVPLLPPPGRGPRGARTDPRGPAARGTRSTRRRAGYAAAGVLSIAGLLLGTAFVVGGSRQPGGAPVAPPVADLTVEHGATTNGVTFGGTGPGVAPTYEDLTRPATGRR